MYLRDLRASERVRIIHFHVQLRLAQPGPLRRSARNVWHCNHVEGGKSVSAWLSIKVLTEAC
jgi:hypothetical protein